MTRLTLMTFMVASLVTSLAACTGEVEGTDPQDKPPDGSTTGDEDTTYDHDNSFDPWVVIDRLAKEGPARFTSRVHSCAKPRYATLGNVLASLGVNITDATALSAGQLYRDGDSAMGAPNFANRIRENIGTTTSGASRMFDIFAAAAKTIVPDGTPAGVIARCPGVPLFNGDNTCNAEGITCLIGVPATPAHVTFCNNAVSSATANPNNANHGKQLAVAAMLAAAYTCE